MSRVDRLIAELEASGGEALVFTSGRPLHVLSCGALRPTPNAPASTSDILALIAEIAPRADRDELDGDCELRFPYQTPGGPLAEVTVDRKGDFVFARLKLIEQAAPPEPEPSGTARDLGLDDFGLGEELALEKAGPAPGGWAPANETARDQDLQADDEPLELDLDRAGPPPAAAPQIDFGGGPEVEAPVPAPEAEPPPEPVSTGAEAHRLAELLEKLRALGGSDLHLAAGSPPRARLCGELTCMDEPVLTPRETEAFFEAVVPAEQRRRFAGEQSLDFSLDIPGLGRFRANAYRERRGLDLVFRAIPARIPSLAELGLPPSVEKLTQFPNGLILVTGPAGCGKSTTQAALLDRINETWQDHIVTVEDPIEFVHPPKKCLVNQREVGRHVRDFAEALRSALREDPDVIMVGELRDLETIQLAITAAETGHLVIGTLHTVDAARTINRLIDVFPGAQKQQIRAMVSESLRGIISQRLLRAAEGNGRVAAFEVLLTDRSISNLIREGKTFQIPNQLKVGRARGMCLMDDAIVELVQKRKVTPQVAMENMEKPEELEKAMGGRRPDGASGTMRFASAAGMPALAASGQARAPAQPPAGQPSGTVRFGSAVAMPAMAAPGQPQGRVPTNPPPMSPRSTSSPGVPAVQPPGAQPARPAPGTAAMGRVPTNPPPKGR